MVRRLKEGMRVSIIATVVLVLLGVAVGFYLGAQQRQVEPDAYGLTYATAGGASPKLAFSNLSIPKTPKALKSLVIYFGRP
jgi:hypothetical protein